MQNYTQLNQLERVEAYEKARNAIVTLMGSQPKREDFHNTQLSKYPQWLLNRVIFLCVLMLIVAFVPSAIRLYDIGKTTFSEAIQHELSAEVVGATVVAMSETGAILFVLSFAVLNVTRLTRLMLGSGAVICGVLALVGNYEVALMNKTDVTLFTWLEALMPPVLTMMVAYILKEVALHSIANRHADNIAYEQAIAEWKVRTSHPEQHPQYMQYVANAIKEAVLEKNKRRYPIRDWLHSLDVHVWNEIVRRELAADNWFVEATTVEAERPLATATSPESPAKLQTVYVVSNGRNEPLQ